MSVGLGIAVQECIFPQPPPPVPPVQRGVPVLWGQLRPSPVPLAIGHWQVQPIAVSVQQDGLALEVEDPVRLALPVPMPWLGQRPVPPVRLALLVLPPPQLPWFVGQVILLPVLEVLPAAPVQPVSIVQPPIKLP